MPTLLGRFHEKLSGLTSMRRDGEQQVLDALVDICEACAGDFRLSQMDHHTRAGRIACMSIVATIRKASAPAPDPSKLEALIEAHPASFKHTIGGLHRLVEHIYAMPGARISPPLDEDAVLRTASPDESVQARILVELARAGGYDARSLLAVAFARAGKERPELFGDVDIATEAAELESALKRVAEARAALTADLAMLARLAANYHCAPTADAVLAAVARG